MDVDFDFYIGHYFEMPQCAYFFLLALGVLFVFFVGMYIVTLVRAGSRHGIVRREYIRVEWHVLTERYYELLFSGTSILFFIAVYYIINRFITMDPYRTVWDKYKDFFLMFLIVFSCLFNSFLDRIFVRFKFLNRDERSAGRLTGMFYMLVIFCYIKFVYQDDNYDMFITYFLGLMVGRFAYFDSTVHDFVKAMDGVRKNIPLMIFALIYTSIMSLYGFKTDYLITHNGVITNIFITHLFICAAIFVLHHIHIAELVTGRGGRQMNIPADDEYAYGDYNNDEYGDESYEGEETYRDSTEYDNTGYEVRDGAQFVQYDDRAVYEDGRQAEGYAAGTYSGSMNSDADYEDDEDFEMVDITR